jgi:hypothetical protein
MALRRPNRSTLLLSGAFAIGAGLIAFALTDGVTGNQSVKPPANVDRLIPTAGELVLRQSQIGIDLASGFRGELIIDGRQIPTYDLAPSGALCSPVTVQYTGKDAVFDPGLSTVYFTPGPGSTIEKFSPGEHSITARFWKLCEDESTASQFSWTFKVS